MPTAGIYQPIKEGDELFLPYLAASGPASAGSPLCWATSEEVSIKD